MSILLLIYWILAKMILAVDSAHTGNGIFDVLLPSSESSDDYLSNDTADPLVRRDITENQLRRQYDGYIFDHTRCIQFNDRILCGYDTNKGTRLDDYTMLDIGNGCRARGDRIECGYDNPVPVYIQSRGHQLLSGDHGDNHHHGEKHHHEGSHLHEGKHHHDGNYHHDDNNPHEDNHHHIENHHRLGNNYPYQGNHHHNRHYEGNQHHEDNHHHDKNHHHDENHNHDKNHHYVENHHHKENNGHQLQGFQLKQIPTRTAMPTNPTSLPIIGNRIKTNFLENKLHKSTFNKLGIQSKVTSKRRIKKMTGSVPLSTVTLKPLTITNTKPNKRQSTLTSKSFNTSTSTPTTSDATNVKTTLTTESSDSNDISSDDETASKIVRLVPAEKPKRRKLIKTFSTSPKLVRKSISDDTIASPIARNCDNARNDAVLREKTSKEDKVKTACVEQDDRIVCYDFKT